MFSISTFKQQVVPVRPNMFFVEMDLPSAIFGIGKRDQVKGSARRGGTLQNWFSKMPLSPSSDVLPKFICRCESTEMPGRTIATTDDTTSFGPNLKFGYENTYADHSFTIIASEDMYERRIFEVWMDNIVYATDLTGKASSSAGLIRYYDDYAQGSMRIFQLNDANRILAKYTLQNAYPIALSPMNLSWEEQNTYQRFTVTMTYRYHVVSFPDLSSNSIFDTV